MDQTAQEHDHVREADLEGEAGVQLRAELQLMIDALRGDIRRDDEISGRVLTAAGILAGFAGAAGHDGFSAWSRAMLDMAVACFILSFLLLLILAVPLRGYLAHVVPDGGVRQWISRNTKASAHEIRCRRTEDLAHALDETPWWADRVLRRLLRSTGVTILAIAAVLFAIASINR